jgi:small subunit ribosomal protein S20
MPNHKSAEKRVRQNAKRQARNKQWKSKVKNRVRDVRDPLGDGKVEAAVAALPAAITMVDKAKSKGVIPKRRASRKISRMMKAIHKAQTATQG